MAVRGVGEDTWQEGGGGETGWVQGGMDGGEGRGSLGGVSGGGKGDEHRRQAEIDAKWMQVCG